jgi:hypothetical protein
MSVIQLLLCKLKLTQTYEMILIETQINDIQEGTLAKYWIIEVIRQRLSTLL